MNDARGIFEKIGDILWLHCDGRTYSISLKEKAHPGRQRKGMSSDSGGELKSPMPGRVLKVNSKAGDSVIAGQTLLVIEAMKMEYALKAPFKGKVKNLMKKAGDQVALDEIVAHVEQESQ